MMAEAAALVLVVEDDAPLRRFLRTALAAQQYRVAEAATIKGALESITTRPPEIVLLDLMLPDGDGIDLVREIRGWSQVPIVVISARGREGDKVKALDEGADDYLTKPFGTNELLARIRVALRHAAQPASDGSVVIEIGPLRIDQASRETAIHGQVIHLTPIEYRLLVFLARNAGKVLTHRQILKEVWGPSCATERQYLRVFMMQLRRKLEQDSARPRLLLTEPGVGYRMKEEWEGDGFSRP